MTICIGGICRQDNEPRFILCSDKRIESEYAGGDTRSKFAHVGDGWWSMLAGETGRAKELTDLYRFTLGNKTAQLTDLQFEAQLRSCARRQKRTLINQFVYSRLGVTYSYVLKKGLGGHLKTGHTRSLQNRPTA